MHSTSNTLVPIRMEMDNDVGHNHRHTYVDISAAGVLTLRRCGLKNKF